MQRSFALLTVALCACAEPALPEGAAPPEHASPGAAPPEAAAAPEGSFLSAGDAVDPARASTVCPSGPTIEGIDVSYWQGAIDWAAVAGDGIEFAFIRVSDGLYYPDTRFQENWDGAAANGIVRGAYQFFRPSLDPIAQAELFLDTMGPLAPGDLPPVIDVETSDGQPDAVVIDGVQQWLDHVEAELGVKPIIYTSAGLWGSLTGDTHQFAGYPLWTAHWGAACPLVPDAWGSWTFWQYSDSGSVAGIGGNVDLDVFDGDVAALLDFADTEPVCGDGWCAPTEEGVCLEDCPVCEPIPPLGRVVDDAEICYVAGGNASYWYEADAGYDGWLRYTHTTDSDTVDNYAIWNLELEEAGEYLVEVYTDAGWAESRQAAYQVHHAGVTDVVVVDQTLFDGWNPVGTFVFDAGGDQWVRLDDNTGEPWDGGATQIVFDAVQLTRIDAPEAVVDTGSPPATTPGGTALDTGRGLDDDRFPAERPGGCGCAAPGGSAGWTALLVLPLLIGSRRARRAREGRRA